MNLQTIKFHDDILEVIENGQKWVSVNRICENLGIATHRQIKKLKSDPSFEAKYIEVQTRGGLQKVFCIPLEKLNGWLFTINPNKVKPEVKQKLIAYKNECFKVLYNHFIQKAAQPPQNCPAEQFDSRINGYKGIIARLKNQNQELKARYLGAKAEIIELKHALEVQQSQENTKERLIDYVTGEILAAIEQLGKDVKRAQRRADNAITNLLAEPKEIGTHLLFGDVAIPKPKDKK